MPKKYKGLQENITQIYARKLDNLDEMNKFLEAYNLPKLNQEESENLNKQITTSEIEAVINKTKQNYFQIIKAPHWMGSQVNFTKYFKN